MLYLVGRWCYRERPSDGREYEEFHGNILHLKGGISSSFALLDDYRIVCPIGLWEPITGISDDAESLIKEAFGSDTGQPMVGWKSLANVDTVLERKTVREVKTRYFQGQTLEKVTYRNRGGNIQSFWVFSVGYSEGYAFEIANSLDDLAETFDMYRVSDWKGLAELWERESSWPNDWPRKMLGTGSLVRTPREPRVPLYSSISSTTIGPTSAGQSVLLHASDTCTA